jgi:phage terminase large subunit GpA-like protein
MMEPEKIDELLDGCLLYRSNLKPAEWYEANMVMPAGSAFPGPIRYAKTPFWKEIVNCADPNHPARDITLMGPAQMGKSAMVLNPVVGYTISENPGNLLFLTGHTDLTKKAVVKLDHMIDNCGIRKLIRPTIVKARNNRTGDTAMEKEFRGGIMIAGSITNHNLMRQNDIMISIADDLDAGEMDKKDTGSTVDLIKGRTKAFENKCKRYWVSSPQIKGRSLIESQFNMSDKRYYFIPCPCCGDMITLKLKVQIDGKPEAGLTWKLDNLNRVIPESVGYICQSCGGFFDDRKKTEWLNEGEWKPTAEAQELYHYGYHITGLYAPHGMTSWFTLAEKYQLCYPVGAPVRKGKLQTFLNIDIGDVYEDTTEEIKATNLQKNIRAYEVGIVPEKISENEGCGKIVLLTCACDLNGTVDDARLDYEVVGWSENGSSWSITHGSVGTFVPGLTRSERAEEERDKWTYDHGKANSVWPEFERILDTVYNTDTGRKMRAFMVGVDTGHYTLQAYTYIENSRHNVVGLKGKDIDKFKKFGIDTANFKPSKERSNLYLVEVGAVKDDMAERIGLRFNPDLDNEQPSGFMNFPTPSGGKYLYSNYFAHYEAEHRVTESKDGEPIAAVWKKKHALIQNHMFDCGVYNMVLKDVFTYIVCRELKIKNYGWKDAVDVVLGRVRS